MTELPLAGKVAIVTGGGRGLGRSMARGLARAGAKVVLTAARTLDELTATAAEIAAEQGEASVATMLADVADPAACEAVVALALDRFGKLDVLVNNAGRGMNQVSESFMTEPTRFWEMPAETWQMMIATNVNGPFLMARAAMPYFLKAGRGRIVNISSNRQTMRFKGFTPYGPSKAALESATMIWAQDLAGTGITVNTLAPGGATATGMLPALVPDELRAKLLDPDIIVPPLIWLASDASDGVTGKRITATEWSLADQKMEDAGI
jgi:NAD(P)-dependent dehydrogenase (short-subunit alcohol dehydrogenase family)